MIATASASISAAPKIQGLNYSEMFFGAIKKPILAMLDKQGWYHWAYWRETGIVCASLILIVILLWIYRNWLR